MKHYMKNPMVMLNLTMTQKSNQILIVRLKSRVVPDHGLNIYITYSPMRILHVSIQPVHAAAIKLYYIFF